MFGLFTQVPDSISGCTDGESNTGLWVWLLCLFTSSWYKSYPKRQTRKLWSATLGLILKCVKGLENPWRAPEHCLPSWFGWFLTGMATSLISCPTHHSAPVGEGDFWDVKCQGWGDVVWFGLWQPHTLCPACPWELCINTQVFPHFLLWFCLSGWVEWKDWKGWGSCVLESHR